MAWLLTAIIAIAFLYLLHQWRDPANKKKLPPGPKGLPILGNFHLLGKDPHHDFYRLSRKYGPIMYAKFGCVPTIIVSSPAAAELFLKTHDLKFATKPYNQAGHYLSYEQRDIIFGRYGAFWRGMRKLCTLELLSNLKIGQFEPMRKAEIGILVDSIREAAAKRETVDLSARLASASAAMTCLMVFGRRFTDCDLDERPFKDVMKETMELSAAVNLSDFFPYLRWLDLQGHTRQLKKLSKTYDSFLERIIEDHVQNKKKNDKSNHDFVDTMLAILDSGEAGFEFDRRHIKSVLLDMLLAGLDTGTASVEWALSDLIKHPTMMKKLQKEIDETVGCNQMVEESHLSSLKYLDCVIKESLRLHPVAPLLLREAMEDIEVGGFHIPKKARVLVNIWAVMKDPEAWPDPKKYIPERFIDNNVDYRGRDFHLIPFGSGRRICPGMQLGLNFVKLLVARLVQCFDWELPNGVPNTELDMKEDFGLIVGRATHLMLIPINRL